jgi:HD-GYP domain-containing protein (c-di-GMP phosphodiesterase class II)
MPSLERWNKLLPQRIPMMYAFLGVLLLISVVPVLFYSSRVVNNNRERLKTNEMLLQNSVTRSLADEMTQREQTLQLMLQSLASAISITSRGDLSGKKVEAPELNTALQQFIGSYNDIDYAVLINADAKGIESSKIQPDELLQNEVKKALEAAMASHGYLGQPFTAGSHTVMLAGYPLLNNGHYYGMVAILLDLQFLTERLQTLSRGGLVTYAVDHNGRYITGTLPDFTTGLDVGSHYEIVHKFAGQPLGNMAFSETTEFSAVENGSKVELLGTCSPVPKLNWAIITQKDKRAAYASIAAMQTSSRLLALLIVLLSIGVSIVSARHITGPIESLTASSQAIAKGDFSHRVRLSSRTEIGELAETFNLMSEDLERLVRDLKRAADENRALFLNSLQMLAGAVDEKDPYTRGHSDRVTKLSVILATEMGLPPGEIDKIRIAAMLHDVGKIGIEDAVLKKPAALTQEEYEIMKTHTTKGANILRPVSQLADMLPGIELHHESLDGKGYPYGLQGAQIPVMARIITVADTFDAMTTNRPYQAAMPLDYVVKRIHLLAGTKFDPLAVAALESAVSKGMIRSRRVTENVPL